MTTIDKDMTDAELKDEGIFTLHVMDGTGDSRIMWDPSRPDEVEIAKASYEAAKAKGYVAYEVDPNDPNKTGNVLRNWDDISGLGKVIMAPQTVGG